MKKLHRILLPTIIGAACVLWSCTKEHVRNDISLEMTDEDSVEAIVDQDLLTAGGTTVNIDEPGTSSASATEVAYVDEVDMQKPVIIEGDRTLKPSGSDIASTGGSVDESLMPDSVVPTPAGPSADADVTVTKLGPLPGTATDATLVQEAAQPANSIALKPPGTAAIPPVTRTTALPPSYPTHTVRSGDTLWLISKNSGCTISELAAANGLSRKSILHIGQTLVIPTARSQQAPSTTGGGGPSVSLSPAEGQGGGASGGTTEPGATVDSGTTTPEGGVPSEGGPKIRSTETDNYTVQQGDSYWKIARRHGVNVSELMSLNDTTSDKLAIGQKILVPRK